VKWYHKWSRSFILLHSREGSPISLGQKEVKEVMKRKSLRRVEPKEIVIGISGRTGLPYGRVRWKRGKG